jgi:hypothetical protein
MYDVLCLIPITAKNNKPKNKDTAEEKMGELEDTALESTESETERKKTEGKNGGIVKL